MSLRVILNEVTLSVNSNSNIGRVVNLLEQDLNQPSITSFHFHDAKFDEELANSCVDFFRTAKQQGRCFDNLYFVCIAQNPSADLVLREAYQFDLFKKIGLWKIRDYKDPLRVMILPESLDSRESVESRESCESSTGKKARNLKILELQGMHLSKEDAESLRHELQDGEDEAMTKTSLEHLWLHEITCLKGALMELTRAFRSNTTLKEIKMKYCNLSDGRRHCSNRGRVGNFLHGPHD